MNRTAPVRLALLGATLLLSACGEDSTLGRMFGIPLAGSGTALGDTISFKRNPNRPVGDAPNINRVLGRGYDEAPLLPEAGNVWPGPLPPDKTMSDLQREGVLGSDPATEPAPRPAARPAATPTAAAHGRVLQTPMGPGVTSVGADGQETVLLPNGQQGTVTPGANGTAIVAMPDGRSFVVPDPR